MKTNLVIFALVTGLCTQAAIAQQREPDIRVMGATSSAGGAQDSIASGNSKRAKPAFLYNNPSMPRDEVIRTFMVDYARCIYDFDKRAVDRMLDQVPGTDAYTQAARRAAVNQCLATGDMRFQQSSLQGAAFIHKYRATFGRTVPKLSEAPFDYATLASSAPPAWKGSYLAYRRFGECVVRRDPIAARTLVMGPIGSASEANAIQTLNPSFSACIDAGANANFTKERITGVVAEALYRLSLPAAAK